MSDGDNWCPREFDGWTCINRTKAGEVARFPCPYFILGFDSKRKYDILLFWYIFIIIRNERLNNFVKLWVSYILVVTIIFGFTTVLWLLITCEKIKFKWIEDLWLMHSYIYFFIFENSQLKIKNHYIWLQQSD